MKKTGRRSPVRGLTLGGVVLLLPIVVLLAAHASPAPYGQLTVARPAKARLSTVRGTAPAGYELAEPGDRTPPGEPTAERKALGAADGKEGIFASFCPYSHSAPDDSIVFPRQPGASHLHDFFANRATDAFSTDDSLRSSGASTCNIPGDTAAYWVPALYENGKRIVPDDASAYYGAGIKDPATIEPFPRGLKMLQKDDFATLWYCYNGRPDTPLSQEVPTCGEGEHLAQVIYFPDCWDGKYLDVPDHRSHMAYGWGYCPATHPVPVPSMRLFVNYSGARGGPNVVLAPEINPSLPHADFVNSWDQAQLKGFVRDCIRADVFCDGTL